MSEAVCDHTEWTKNRQSSNKKFVSLTVCGIILGDF